MRKIRINIIIPIRKSPTQNGDLTTAGELSSAYFPAQMRLTESFVIFFYTLEERSCILSSLPIQPAPITPSLTQNGGKKDLADIVLMLVAD